MSDPPAGEAKHPKLPRTVVTLGVVSFLHDLAGDMVTPLMPAFIASLGAGPEMLGLIEGLADATASLLKFVSGHLADRLGRLKALTLAGYGVTNVLRPFLAVAHLWWQVLFIRFGDRVGKGLRASPRDALLAAVTPESIRGRAYGFHQMIEYFGSATGPALGFLLLAAGMPLRRVFAWSVVPGVLTIVFLVFGVREVAPPKSTGPVQIGLPPSGAYRRLLLASVVFALGNSSDTFLLWRAKELGVATELAPVLWVVLHVVRSATSVWGGGLSDRRGRRFAILWGWFIYVLVYLGFGFATAPWHVWVLIAVYGLYYGLTESAAKAMIIDLVDERWRGRALGAYHAAVGFALLPASVAFGAVYRALGPRYAFGLGATLALAASLLFRRVTAPTETEPSA